MVLYPSIPQDRLYHERKIRHLRSLKSVRTEVSKPVLSLSKGVNATFYECIKDDGPVKSRKTLFFVIPAEADFLLVKFILHLDFFSAFTEMAGHR